jgi:hypothetical protein
MVSRQSPETQLNQTAGAATRQIISNNSTSEFQRSNESRKGMSDSTVGGVNRCPLQDAHNLTEHEIEERLKTINQALGEKLRSVKEAIPNETDEKNGGNKKKSTNEKLREYIESLESYIANLQAGLRGGIMGGRWGDRPKTSAQIAVAQERLSAIVDMIRGMNGLKSQRRALLAVKNVKYTEKLEAFDALMNRMDQEHASGGIRVSTVNEFSSELSNLSDASKSPYLDNDLKEKMDSRLARAEKINNSLSGEWAVEKSAEKHNFLPNPNEVFAKKVEDFVSLMNQIDVEKNSDGVKRSTFEKFKLEKRRITDGCQCMDLEKELKQKMKLSLDRAAKTELETVIYTHNAKK